MLDSDEMRVKRPHEEIPGIWVGSMRVCGMGSAMNSGVHVEVIGYFWCLMKPHEESPGIWEGSMR